MSDFDALLLALLALAGLAAGLAIVGVLTVKVDLKRPAPSQPRRTSHKQPPQTQPVAEGDPWNPEPPF